MKTLVAAMALAVLVASQAFAQSWDPDMGSGNVVHAFQGASTYQNAGDTFAHPRQR